MHISGYLIQEKLNDIITQSGLFSDIIFEHRVGDTRYRWDITCSLNGKKLHVEFDGDRHYTNSLAFRSDEVKDLYAKQHNEDVIRIPYFVQLNSETFKYYFGLNLDLTTDFSHGFVTTKVFPASFCSLGLIRYNKELNNLPVSVVSQINESLAIQSERYGVRYVI
jgi:hypothetical protein